MLRKGCVSVFLLSFGAFISAQSTQIPGIGKPDIPVAVESGNNSITPGSTYFELPDEMYLKIFKHLDDKDLLSAERVSTQWERVVESVKFKHEIVCFGPENPLEAEYINKLKAYDWVPHLILLYQSEHTTPINIDWINTVQRASVNDTKCFVIKVTPTGVEKRPSKMDLRIDSAANCVKDVSFMHSKTRGCILPKALFENRDAHFEVEGLKPRGALELYNGAYRNPRTRNPCVWPSEWPVWMKEKVVNFCLLFSCVAHSELAYLRDRVPIQCLEYSQCTAFTTSEEYDWNEDIDGHYGLAVLLVYGNDIVVDELSIQPHLPLEEVKNDMEKFKTDVIDKWPPTIQRFVFFETNIFYFKHWEHRNATTSTSILETFKDTFGDSIKVMRFSNAADNTEHKYWKAWYLEFIGFKP